MRDFRSEYARYKRLIDHRLRKLAEDGEGRPRSIAVPLRYVLSGGGKRLRPILLLLAYEAVRGDSVRAAAGISKKRSLARVSAALDAALAIEALHNFTLVHDDIMDHAPSRRGRATVHTKWDENTAILVGDELVALAYQSLLKTKTSRLREILRVFTEGLLEVCEGQGFDKEFESRCDVTLEEYLKMIEKKTGRMFSVALEIGGLVGDASTSELRSLRKYGYHIGRAFQLQDDLLDVIGDEKFGKKIGGDLFLGKKTYPLLTAHQLARKRDQTILQHVMEKKRIGGRQVKKVREIYERYGVVDGVRDEVHANIRQAQRALGPLEASKAKEMLRWVADMLRDRRI